MAGVYDSFGLFQDSIKGIWGRRPTDHSRDGDRPLFFGLHRDAFGHALQRRDHEFRTIPFLLLPKEFLLKPPRPGTEGAELAEHVSVKVKRFVLLLEQKFESSILTFTRHRELYKLVFTIPRARI